MRATGRTALADPQGCLRFLHGEVLPELAMIAAVLEDEYVQRRPPPLT